jgi:hypothetical protein
VANKIDSNITGLAFAEETSLKTLPGTPVWYGVEPNSYSDFGGDIKTVARAPIDPSRQNKKGTVTDLDAAGAFNIDFTKSNLVRLLQGFFFADARELPSTKPLNATAIALTSVTAGTKTYAAASGLAVFVAGQLIFGSGFTNSANNGLKTVASSTAGTVVTVESLIDEASPPAAAGFQSVGFQFASADINMAVTSGIPALISTVMDFTTLPGLTPGKWIFLGSDTAGERFANNVGYCRIKSIAAHSLVFDDTTFTAVDETGTGKTIRIFAGTTIRNEKTPSLIKRRSYNIERQLGSGPTATQAEYLEGAIPNEFTLNIPQADKLHADVSFVACDNTQKTGEVGDTIKSGTRIGTLGEQAFNTSSDIYRMKMAVLDPATSNPTQLFGYVSEATVTVKNNIKPDKAVGILGAFDATAGNFEAGGSVTAYFSTVSAVKAVRGNSDVGFSIIGASHNAGFVFDIPLLGLGGGRLNVEKDAPIKLPLTPSGAENAQGYTMMFDSFAYLPTLAMPV